MKIQSLVPLGTARVRRTTYNRRCLLSRPSHLSKHVREDVAHQTEPKQNRKRLEAASHLSDYELAALAALYEPGDKPKVMLLAQQWGYPQEQLCAIWQRLHP